MQWPTTVARRRAVPLLVRRKMNGCSLFGCSAGSNRLCKNGCPDFSLLLLLGADEQIFGVTEQILGQDHTLTLLRPRRERPRRRAAEQRHERAPFHSITSSARATRVAGTSRPSALAAFRLSTNSNLVGCCTGRSAGLAPLRMRST